MIRKATTYDLTGILSVIDEAKARIRTTGSPQWQNGYPNEQIFLNDISQEALFVYEIEGVIVGVMAIYPYEKTYDVIEGNWLNDEDYVVIHRIAVSNYFVGKGITKKMFDYAFDYFKSNNMRIDTHELNQAMINYLIKDGFVLCGKIYLEQPIDKERLAFHKCTK